MAKSIKSITPRDLEIGRRIRARRTLILMSQTTLGEKLGITFQQVQKYEKGINRVGSGRLEQIAKILQCPVSYFFDDVKNADGMEDGLQFLQVHGAVRIAKAFSGIRSAAVRSSLVTLVEAVEGAQGRAPK